MGVVLAPPTRQAARQPVADAAFDGKDALSTKEKQCQRALKLLKIRFNFAPGEPRRPHPTTQFGPDCRNWLNWRARHSKRRDGSNPSPL